MEESQENKSLKEENSEEEYRYPDNKPNSKHTNGKCDICGREFFIENYRGDPRVRYCCSECEGEAKRKEIEEKTNEALPRKYIDLETDRKQEFKRLYGKSVFLWGNVGVGKSVMAASLAKAYIRKGGEVLWVNYAKLILKLQSAYREERSDSPSNIVTDVARFQGLIILDDLGAEKYTDYARQVMHIIVNCREENLLPLIITSNCSLDDIDEKIDPRVASRIAGICEVVKLEGNDRRLDKRDRSFNPIPSEEDRSSSHWDCFGKLREELKG